MFCETPSMGAVSEVCQAGLLWAARQAVPGARTLGRVVDGAEIQPTLFLPGHESQGGGLHPLEKKARFSNLRRGNTEGPTRSPSRLAPHDWNQRRGGKGNEIVGRGMAR